APGTGAPPPPPPAPPARGRDPRGGAAPAGEAQQAGRPKQRREDRLLERLPRSPGSRPVGGEWLPPGPREAEHEARGELVPREPGRRVGSHDLRESSDRRSPLGLDGASVKCACAIRSASASRVRPSVSPSQASAFVRRLSGAFGRSLVGHARLFVFRACTLRSRGLAAIPFPLP